MVRMAHRERISLQINMHPNDAGHVRHILPHQLRVWGEQVDRTLVILDLHRSRAGRYRNQDFDRNLHRLRQELNRLARASSLDVLEVDYSPAAKRAVARRFFDTHDLPDKAWDGGPFYSYFFGLWAAQTDYILRMDSDMLYGGGSLSWIAEAIALLEDNSDVMFVAPLSGPPRADGRLLGQRDLETGAARKHATLPYTFLFPTVSTRVFLTGPRLLRDLTGQFELSRPGRSQWIRARLLGNPSRALEAETVLSRNMQRLGCWRADMLGNGAGMWTLHPPYRSPAFYHTLPELIDRIERDDVPDRQRGHYDINDSMIDWSEPRRRNTKMRRWLRHLSQVVGRMTERYS